MYSMSHCEVWPAYSLHHTNKGLRTVVLEVAFSEPLDIGFWLHQFNGKARVVLTLSLIERNRGSLSRNGSSKGAVDAGLEESVSPRTMTGRSLLTVSIRGRVRETASSTGRRCQRGRCHNRYRHVQTVGERWFEEELAEIGHR